MAGLSVVKFGGSSLADAQCIRRAMGIVSADERRRVVVVSAPGKADGCPKVTDDLRTLASQALRKEPLSEEIIQRLEARFTAIERELCGSTNVSQGLRDLIGRRAQLVTEHKRADSLEAVGEYVQANIISNFLNRSAMRACFLDSGQMLVVDKSQYGTAFVPLSSYSRIARTINQQLDLGNTIIVPGYYGRTWHGELRTFKRGGSDYTAAIISAALGAALHENFTDVNGIRATDYPQLCKTAPRISRMGLRELAELTLGGSFGVFQADAVAPLARAGIPIHLQNTFNEGEGTWVVPDAQLDQEYITDNPVRGIAFRPGFALFDVLQYDMGQQPGCIAAISDAFARRGISLEHMPTSQISAAAIASEAQLGDTSILIQDLKDVTQADDVAVHRNLGLISIVGSALPRLTGIAGKVCGILGEHGINIQMFSYAGGINMVIGTINGQTAQAVELLFNEFFDKTKKTSAEQ